MSDIQTKLCRLAAMAASVTTQANDEIDRLQARCAVLEADAMRYRWLRDNREARAPEGTLHDVYDDDGTLLYGAWLDVAIDVCRALTPDAPAEGAKE